MRSIALCFLLLGCEARMAEDTGDWYGAMGDLDEDVLEPIAFTNESYAMPSGPGIVAVENAVRTGSRVYSNEASPSGTCPFWETSNALPIETWAMVTLHPRLYYKTRGCDAGSDEKYYGSYFIEDESGGIFVLNDSKVAHYEMGDRIKIRVDAVAESFGLPRVMTHEVLEVDRGPYPIKYVRATATSPGSGAGEWQYDDLSLIGRVVRVEGTVVDEPDTFGQFHVVDDDDQFHTVNIDSELNRRKYRAPIGSRVQVTGPVLNSFGHKIVVMRIGQLEILEN